MLKKLFKIFKKDKPTKLNTPEDYDHDIVEIPEDRWIQYVAESPLELTQYLDQRKLNSIRAQATASSLFVGVLKELEDAEVISEENIENFPKLNVINSSLVSGYFSVLFMNYDIDKCSTMYNGIMPDGSFIEADDEEAINEFRGKLIDHLLKTDASPEQADASHLQYRLEEDNNLLNITCDKCGTPHNFKDTVPATNFRCTLCDNDLVFYYGLPEEEQIRIMEESVKEK